MTDEPIGPADPTGSADPDPDETASDRARLDRRTAMKAALGGAAAAAVWSAPRIEGLSAAPSFIEGVSVAPDYAAAASCNAISSQVISLATKNSNNCGYYGDVECFGNNCCGSFGFSGVVPNAKNVLVNGAIGGDVSGDNGFVNISVNAIDTPFVQCTVNVGGNCNNATFRTANVSGNTATQSFVFNTNGNASAFIDCQGGGAFLAADTDATIRINVACVCN